MKQSSSVNRDDTIIQSQNYEYIQPVVNSVPKTKEFDMDVVNEYLYKKTKRKRETSLADKSLESSIQLNT